MYPGCSVRLRSHLRDAWPDIDIGMVIATYTSRLGKICYWVLFDGQCEAVLMYPHEIKEFKHNGQ